MAKEFMNLAGHSICVASISHVIWEDDKVTVNFVGGGVLTGIAGDDADVIAKALGRHDAKHLTAKEAKAEEKAAAAAEKAAEKAAEPEPEPKPPAKGHK